MKKIVVYSCSLVFILSASYAIWLQGKIVETAKQIPKEAAPFLIVLGAKVNGEVPSLSLRYRIEAAIDYAQKNPDTFIIASGGQGLGEDISEAEAMKRAMIRSGIEESRIWLEDQSTSTYENLAFTKEAFDVNDAVIVSNDFHLYRALYLADQLEIEAEALAAPTPKVVVFQSTIREYLAITKTFLLGR